MRIALVQEGPQPRPIVSKFYAVNVNVPQGSTQVPFTQVEDDLTFVLPADKNLEKYVIYVGFDPHGAPPPAAKKKAPVKKSPPKKQVKKQTPAMQQQPAQQQSPTFTSPPQQQPPTFTPPAQQQQQAPSNVPTFDPPPR